MGQVWKSFVFIFSCLGFARTESSTVGGFCAFPCSLQNRTYINAVLDSGFTYTVSSDDPTIQLVSNTITNSTEIWECFQRVGPFYALRRKINETHSYYRCLKDTMYEEPHDIVIFYFIVGTMALPNYPTICDVCNGRHLSIMLMKDTNVETFLAPCEQASNFSEESKEYSYADEKSYDETTTTEGPKTTTEAPKTATAATKTTTVTPTTTTEDNPTKNNSRKKRAVNDNSMTDASSMDTSNKMDFSRDNSVKDKADIPGTYYIWNDKDWSTDDHKDIIEAYYVPKDESQNAKSSFDTSSDRSFSSKGKLCCLKKSTYSSISLYYTDSNSFKSRKHSKGCKRVKVPPLVCNIPSICPVVYYGQIPCSGCEPSEGPGLCCNCV